MPRIEYTELQNGYVITSYEEEPSCTAHFSFNPKCEGTLFLKGESCKVINGSAKTKLKSLSEGELLPVIVKDGGECKICQKLLSEAGTLFPMIRSEEALIEANRHSAYLYKKLETIEKRLDAIYEKEHPGSIF